MYAFENILIQMCLIFYIKGNSVNMLVLYNFYFLLGKECWKGREGEEEYEPVTAELLVLYSGYMYTQYGIQNRLAYSLHLFMCIFTI